MFWRVICRTSLIFYQVRQKGFVFISFDLAVFGQIDRYDAQSEQKQGSGKNPAEFFVETERASRPLTVGEECRQQQSGQYGQRNRVDVGNFYPCVDGVDFGVKRTADFAEFFSFSVQTFANAGNQGQFVRSKGLPPFEVFFAPDFLKFGFGSIDAFDDFVLFDLKVKLRVALILSTSSNRLTLADLPRRPMRLSPPLRLSSALRTKLPLSMTGTAKLPSSSLTELVQNES